jgi:hypothetical protein
VRVNLKMLPHDEKRLADETEDGGHVGDAGRGESRSDEEAEEKDGASVTEKE